MLGRRLAGLILIAGGGGSALWGLKGDSLATQNPVAIVAGGVLVLIGLMLALQRDSTAPPFQRTASAASRMPPSPALLASLTARSPTIAANFANQELLAEVVGQIRERNKINAIKTVRGAIRCDLRSAKELVEEVEHVMKLAATGG